MIHSRLYCFANLARRIGETCGIRMMSVLREEAFIDGAWVTALRGGSFKVYNPTDGSCVGEVPSMDIDDARNAVTCAHTAFNTWSQSTAKERSDFLKSWFNEIKKNTDELARILSLESGKPLAEATGEIAYGNSFIEWYSEEARRCYGEVLCSPFKNKQLFHIKQPIGVAALITPWNFPMAMIARKAGAALAAGCTCVVKPAEDTPLSSLVLAYCAEQAGLPNGVFNVVPVERSNAATVGKYLCESPLVAGVTFTGSTTVGKLLYEQCAKGVKRISLELGGNAPFIVFRTSDIEKAVDGAIAGKFRNCGQTCVSPNRFLIEDKIFDEFVAKLTDRIKEKLELGNPIILPQNKQRLGPLINLSQLEKVDCFVKDAVAKGAVIHCGGKLASYLTGGLFYEPTLLSNITPNMMCYSEEIFGPVVSCVKFSNEEEAVTIANSTKSGLAGYFYTNDIPQAWRVAKKLQVGMVGINESLISTTEAAFGGIKESGIGREGSHHGLEEFLYIKYLCLSTM